MTDLEITRLCAEAMFDALEWEQRLFDYDPLHDDAQAMALVRKFALNCNDGEPAWEVWIGNSEKHTTVVFSNDLNRAICECVAKMQAQKSGAGQD